MEKIKDELKEIKRDLEELERAFLYLIEVLVKNKAIPEHFSPNEDTEKEVK